MMRRGFTIVELLIVVVVIAILAAITIVGYNGIQNRAKNTQAVAAASTYAKAIEAYVQSKGEVPMTVSAVQCFEGTNCWGGASASGSTALQNNLRQVISTIPSMPSGFAALITNATTDAPGNATYTGWYMLVQVTGESCPTIGGLRWLNTSGGDSLRNCRYAYPA